MRKLMPKTHKDVCSKKRMFMKLAGKAKDPDIKQEYEQAVNHCDRLTARINKKVERRLYFFPALILLYLCLILGGCSVGASVAASVGGSIHDPKHPDLAKIVEATPIMSTSATKQFALPMVPGDAK